MKPSHRPEIENEPHLQNRSFESPDEAPLGMDAKARQLDGSDENDVEHSVWDEPALSELAGKPSSKALCYSQWIQAKISKWPQSRAWLVTLAVGFIAAPILGIVGFGISQLFSGTQRGYTLHALILLPLYDALFKVWLPLWIVERRPYYFTGWFQIFFCMIISSALFAAPFAWLMSRGWNGAFPDFQYSNVMVFSYFSIHIVSAAIASFGLEKIWGRPVFHHQRPEINDGASWLLGACAIHVLWSVGVWGYHWINNFSAIF